MKTPRLLLTAAVVLVASSPSFATQQKAFLPAQKAVEILADGHPWSADAPDGAALKFTLQKDGTGIVSGFLPFALSLTWAVKGDDVCISGRRGTKCLRFHVIPNGLQAWDGDKPDLKFSR